MKFSLLILFLVTISLAQVQEENGVLILTDKNFDEVIKKYDFVMVDFYAPWCSHCIELAPIYQEVANKIRSNSAQLAKVDCTAYNSLCVRYSINGYPTLLLFQKHLSRTEYTGQRKASDLLEWIRLTMAGEQPINEEMGVLVLTDRNFDQAIKKYEFLMVDFYAPWCSHCVEFAPIYSQAARQIRSDTIQLAKVDCTTQTVCQKYQINGYPTFFLFTKNQRIVYDGERKLQDLLNWLNTRTLGGGETEQKQIASSNTKYQEEAGVLIITNENFDQIIKEFEFVMVDFYAPWCSHCQDFAPIYAQAARQIRSNQVQLGKVDCTTSNQICQRYSISGYPTLVFFQNGNNIEFNGQRTVQEVVNWIKKKMNLGSQEQKSLDQLRQTIAKNQVVLAFFGQDKGSEEFSQFSLYSRRNQLLVSIHTFNPAFKDEYKIESLPALVLFKQFDDRKSLFKGNYNYDEIHRFVESSQYPTMMNFDLKTAQRIFGGNQTNTLFLIHNQNQPSQQGEKQLRLAVSTIREKILICIANVNDHHGMRLSQYLKLQTSSWPQMVIIEPGETNVNMKRLEKDITKSNIIEFVDDYVKSKNLSQSERKTQRVEDL